MEDLADAIGRLLRALAVSVLEGLELFVTAFLGPFASTFMATLAGAAVGVAGSFWLHRRQETATYRRELREAIAGVIAASSEYEQQLRAKASWDPKRLQAALKGQTTPSVDRGAYLTSIEVASLVARNTDAIVMDALVAAVEQMHGVHDDHLVDPVHAIGSTLVRWQREEFTSSRATAEFRLLEGTLRNRR